MKEILELISEEMKQAFEKAGYPSDYGKVNVSNRPDLCELQCNGAMALAKQFKKAPIMIANEVVAALEGTKVFSKVEAVMPGFLNLDLSPEYLASYLTEMAGSEKYGLAAPEKVKKIVVDYGGPNVAKPLHVGHLRSAVIGESVKRIAKYMGHDVTGDIHMGDWGLQMGLIITELKERKPELPYFDDSFTGEYPTEAPFTISELEEIYPTASGKSKEDEAYKAKALEATKLLQDGVRGYRALWDHIIRVSVTDLKKNYTNLNVAFDLWNGESSVHDIIPGMVQYMKDGGYIRESDGALVVDVKEETDTKEMPPCMILKSDGAALYNTTDLATLMQRRDEIDPDQVIYVVDKRQGLYFEQVFRCARKTKIVKDDTELFFLGLGTVNGKDGHAFKTREGGVMRLESLVSQINEQMFQKITENHAVEEAEARETAKMVALASIKYGDLSNQASKDYIFDIDRFTSFEGDTGPYILYTMVRIKSILNKYAQAGGNLDTVALQVPVEKDEKELMLCISRFNAMMKGAYEDIAPHKVCAYIYEMANAFNHFYHGTSVMGEKDETKKAGYIALLKLTLGILEDCIDVLGFEAPERM